MIEVRNLEKTYPGSKGMLAKNDVRALRGVSLAIPDSGTISLIGESGCGKTTLGRILAGFESHTGGELLIDGDNLAHLSKAEQKAKLHKVQMIHQDPYSALNPARTLGQALYDPLTLQAKKTGKDSHWVTERARELLAMVGLDPDETLYRYPHNLSGGQRQRVVIARALTVDPQFLVADEAVSMIDVSLRLGILQLLHDLQAKLGITLIFITHDVASARYVADKGVVSVLYRGEIVEMGLTDQIIQTPKHPYTQALLSAMPVLRGLETEGVDRYIPALAIDQGVTETGCLFAPRCAHATQKCRQEHPELILEENNARSHACFYPKVRHVVAKPL